MTGGDRRIADSTCSLPGRIWAVATPEGLSVARWMAPGRQWFLAAGRCAWIDLVRRLTSVQFADYRDDVASVSEVDGDERRWAPSYGGTFLYASAEDGRVHAS
jgi:hypothetical protein